MYPPKLRPFLKAVNPVATTSFIAWYTPRSSSSRRCRSFNNDLCHLVEVPDMNLAIQVAVQSQQVVEFSYS